MHTHRSLRISFSLLSIILAAWTWCPQMASAGSSVTAFRPVSPGTLPPSFTAKMLTCPIGFHPIRSATYCRTRRAAPFTERCGLCPARATCTRVTLTSPRSFFVMSWEWNYRDSLIGNWPSPWAGAGGDMQRTAQVEICLILPAKGALLFIPPTPCAFGICFSKRGDGRTGNWCPVSTLSN